MSNEYEKEYNKAKEEGKLIHVSGIGILIEKLDKMIQMQDKANLRLYQLVQDVEKLKNKYA